ncbi:N-succinylarginine dihydrolase [Niveibacterium sp. 24ML]|uniref:N-succinylarginine dihydrolase n=1 Tax=Niveibacterium sp. 24ML TaxID=2985512 RepID=UPI002271124E|nr:N-succinylarginine dihydrolase [Niveibacterium sp. 24ML]MCX9156456.1 N-succinylarginine dihydrolase [Niveibacterium sp. 24ML]
MTAFEANFDGLVGPTHNYGGLSFGNVASQNNTGDVSNPREAALQGLAKMKALADRGFRQAVLPPHERPDVASLRALGFTGSDAEVLRAVAASAPALLPQISSASCMWTANAATVSPSADTADGRTHFTPANLNNKFHRSIEHPTTGRVLKAIFADPRHFAHHAALPACAQFGDEGAANHTRLCGEYGDAGVELFVYGRAAFAHEPAPVRYPARQTREACEAIARAHGLAPDRTVIALQNPDVIDAGVFHNDVIAVGNRDVLFFHEQAFHDKARLLADVQRGLGSVPLRAVEVPNEAVSVADAVSTYLFNSQLLARPDGRMLLVVPDECRRNASVWAYLEAQLASGGPIAEVAVFDLKQSMKNGGGPACLRLRVVLNEAEAAAVAPGVWMNDALYARLTAWVGRHYRDRLAVADLADPQLLLECRTALDELSGILGIGSVYPFQLA